MEIMDVADFLGNLVASQTPHSFPFRKVPLPGWLSA